MIRCLFMGLLGFVFLLPEPIAAAPYNFELSVSEPNFPILIGKTDVPDGTKLSFMIKKPWLPDGKERIARGIPACEDDCFPATDMKGGWVNAIVRRGQFTAGPFSFGGKRFTPNKYILEIYIAVDPRTATIEEIKSLADQRPIYKAEIEVTGALISPRQDYSQLRWRDGYLDSGRFIRADWRVFEADNGFVAALDVKSIVRIGLPNVYAVVYLVDGDLFARSNLRGFTFDCRGRYSVSRGSGYSPGSIASPLMFAPPRSVARQLSDLACEVAPPTKF